MLRLRGVVVVFKHRERQYNMKKGNGVVEIGPMIGRKWGELIGEYDGVIWA